MLKHRIPSYNDMKYKEGDEVYVKERDSEGWGGPWKVKCQYNKIVTIRKDDNEYQVAACRVRPVILENTSVETDDVEEDQPENDNTNKPSDGNDNPVRETRSVTFDKETTDDEWKVDEKNEDPLKIKLKRSSRDMEKEGIRHLYYMNQMD